MGDSVGIYIVGSRWATGKDLTTTFDIHKQQYIGILFIVLLALLGQTNFFMWRWCLNRSFWFTPFDTYSNISYCRVDCRWTIVVPQDHRWLCLCRQVKNMNSDQICIHYHYSQDTWDVYPHLTACLFSCHEDPCSWFKHLFTSRQRRLVLQQKNLPQV